MNAVIAPEVEEALKKPFGTVFVPEVAYTDYRDGKWGDYVREPYGPMQMYPSAHVLHYASTCFEGLKAHRADNGEIRIFRLDRHMARLRQSAGLLCLPEPDTDALSKALIELINDNADWVPAQPGSLYIRPVIYGTAPHIGAAAAPPDEIRLTILLSPVGDYFSGGPNPLKILIEENEMRCAPHFGMAKAGGNYASALSLIQKAKRELGVAQVLFAPDGDVQETGAANFILLRDGEIMTKPLDRSFLHGVTRDSLLTLAKDMGYTVTEKNFDVTELLEWCKEGEAALSGTAAVLAGIGTFIHKGRTHTVGNGGIGPNTQKLRQALVDIHGGQATDPYNWLTPVG